MLILVETPGGYGLFRVRDSKLLEVEDAAEVAAGFSSAAAAQQLVQLEAFSQFRDTQQAVEEALRLSESRVGGGLKKFLKKHLLPKKSLKSSRSSDSSSKKTTNEDDEEDIGDSAASSAASLQLQLAVSDRALGAAIKNKFGVDVVFSPATHEIIRGIKEHLAALLQGFSEKDRQTMAVSLAHSLNRFKLKFSPEKVDTMIIQAVALLDDLDRELNNFAMRLKEWYGWHFPELAKIVGDNLLYAKTVQLIGFRTNTKHVDLSTLLPEEVAAEVKMSAETSMGTDMTEEDLQHINTLAARVEELTEYRVNLADYLKLRMKTVAPNLTYMVGEVIGARLMAHAGSLLNLSKQPASTIQILGAEKALFRALKTKSHTPKYGLLYHAALVGQAPPKLKGKISRVLAAKLSLCIRVDALTEAAEAAVSAAGAKVKTEAAPLPPAAAEPTVAISCRRHVEVKLLQLEQQLQGGLARPSMKPQIARYEPRRETQTGKVYDTAADVAKDSAPPSRLPHGKGKKHTHPQETEASNESPNGPAPEDESRPKKKKVKIEQTDS